MTWHETNNDKIRQLLMMRYHFSFKLQVLKEVIDQKYYIPWELYSCENHDVVNLLHLDIMRADSHCHIRSGSLFTEARKACG